MNKQEFLMELKAALNGLPHEDIEERLDFYSEMIDDKVEEGISEKEAVQSVGDVGEIASQIIAETPLTKLVKQKVKSKKKLKAWESVLIILGSPVWLPIMISLIAVALSLYLSIWSIIISLWCVFISLVGCAIGGILGGILFAVEGNIYSGIAMIGAGIICIGLSIFAYYGCKAITKGFLILTKKPKKINKKDIFRHKTCLFLIHFSRR